MNSELWADFRSDACTLPTPDMRRAIASAEVGNDDFSEDPAVRRLEERTADLLGKPAALFVQSGTMGNLVALCSHLERGETLLTSRDFHIFYWERDAVDRVVGAGFDFLPEETCGAFTTLETAGAVGARSRLLSLENPVNRLGGTLLSLAHMRQLHEWAARRGVPVHLDGARLFNAARALRAEPASLAACADTVSVSFNKALGAPAGAAVAASEELIARARRIRWMLGGAWKQGGVLAAACLFGLDRNLERIEEDHRLARRLAEGLSGIPGIAVDLERVATNIVFMKVEDRDVDLAGLSQELRARGLGIGRFKEGGVCRLVTHRDITPESIERFLGLIRQLMSGTQCRGSNPRART
jgi:threonine aldolase